MHRSTYALSPPISASPEHRGPAGRRVSARFVSIAIIGIALICGSLALRNSRWLHDLTLRKMELPELETIVRNNPNDGLARYYLAKRYYLARHFADARLAYGEAVRLAPDDPRAHLGLGLSLYELGGLDDARQEFEQTLRLDKGSAWAEYMLGTVAWFKGHPGDAALHMKRSTDLDPRSDIEWYGLGVCYMQLNRSDVAIDALRHAIARNKGNAKYHTALGELLINKGNTEEGKHEYERALQIDPNFGPATGLMGGFYLHKSPGPEALVRARELLERATRLSTYHPEQVYLDLGELYVQTAHYEKAVAALNESIRIDSRDERPYFALATAYRRLKRESAAQAAERKFREVSDQHVRMTTLEARLQHDPRNQPTRLALARLYRSLGLRDKAAAQYAVYLRHDPSATVAMDELGSLVAEMQPKGPFSATHDLVPSAMR